MFSNHDCAAVVTTAVLQLVLSSSAPAAARGRIKDLLRTEFADVQRQAIADRCNENQQTECLAEVRARIKQGKPERQACAEVAAEWGLPGNSFAAAAQRLRDLLRSSKT